MSLQVWLPLNGNLENKGLSNIAITNNGATIDDNGKIGKCYSFGNNKTIKTTIDIPASPISASCWIYLNSFHGSYNYIISLNDTGGYSDQCLALTLESATKLVFAIGGNSGCIYNSPTSFVGKWTHLAITHDGSIIRGYVNGVEVVSKTSSSSKTRNNLTIGCRNGSTAYYTDCKINDVRIYDHCLSTKEVKEISKTIVLHYPFNEETILMSRYSNITWNQNAEGSFEQPFSNYWNKARCTTSISNSVITCTTTSTAAAGICPKITPVSGHKYIYMLDWNAPNGITIQVNPPGRMNVSGDGTWHHYEKLFKYPTTSSNLYITIAAPVGTMYMLKNIMLFDLTVMFGAENEPTLEEFKMMFPNDYYPYDSGTTKNLASPIYDLSGCDNNAIVNGIAELSNDTAKYDKSTVLNASCSISTPYVPNINNDSVSFGGWFKFNRNDITNAMPSHMFDDIHTTAGGNLIGNNNYSGIGIMWQSNNIRYDGQLTYISIYGSIITNDAGLIMTSSFAMPFDEWVHIFLVYNKQNNTLSLYKNGFLLYSPSLPAFSDAVNNNIVINLNHIAIGDGPAMRIPMQISDIRSYANALSNEDVLQICTVSASIDRQAAMYSLQYIENDNTSIKIKKTGVTNAFEIVEKNNDDRLGDDISNASFSKQGVIKSKRFYEN